MLAEEIVYEHSTSLVVERAKSEIHLFVRLHFQKDQ